MYPGGVSATGGFLRVTGWGPFRMPGERARLAELNQKIAEQLAAATPSASTRPPGAGGPAAGSPGRVGDAASPSTADENPHSGGARRLGNRALLYSMRGDDVRDLQQSLYDFGFGRNGLVIDGFFGRHTRQALIDFQGHYGIRDDGVCGSVTMLVSEMLAKENVRASNPASAETLDAIRWLGSEEDYRYVFVDPLYLRTEPFDSETNQLLTSMRTLVKNDLERRAHLPAMYREDEQLDRDADFPVPSPAEFANDHDARLAILLSVDTDERKGEGIATFHAARSFRSKALATYIQEEVVAATGTVDRGIHEEPSDVLGRIDAPAVHVCIGNLGSSHERKLLLDDVRYVEMVSRGIAEGVRRLFLLGRKTPPISSSPTTYGTSTTSLIP